jgi:exosortase/archaeosortase family protein
MTALGLLYLWLLHFPSRWQSVLLLIAIPVVAIVSNIFRLSSILMIAYHYGSVVAINYYHDFAGAVFWALSLALMLLIGRSLEWRRTSATA